MTTSAVVLAAGQGTRMKSSLPKVLHLIAGKPMVALVLEAVSGISPDKIALVIGHGATQVRELLNNSSPKLSFVVQREQLGTGHAVLQAREALRDGAGTIVVLHADHPLVRAETLRDLVARHGRSNATITMLTAHSDESMGFGRVLRDAGRAITGVVEENDATSEQLAVRELNCGMYCFEATWLWEHLPRIKPSQKKKEYYLTDLIAMAVIEKCKVDSVQVSDLTEIVGVNTRVHLAQAEKIMRQRINEALMLNGVTMVDPATTYIDAEVEIGPDTTLEPNTHLGGKTRVGSNCRIGPNTTVRASLLGNNCEINSSVVEESTVEDDVKMGPFSHLRPGSYIARGVHLGNYVEVKNSRLGENTLAGHFCYLGDAEIGARVNIGAGTITVNYNGKEKNKTVIGEDAFIGSDTMLVAPVTIGARARTGAGSVVTKDVPPATLAVGVPARVIRRLE